MASSKQRPAPQYIRNFCMPQVIDFLRPSTRLYTVQREGISRMLALETIGEFNQGYKNFIFVYHEKDRTFCWNTFTQKRVTLQSVLSGEAGCRGGILADEPGMCKTLQLLSLIKIDYPEARRQQAITAGGPWSPQPKPRHSATIVVVQPDIMTEWISQVQEHFKDNNINYIVYEGPDRRTRHDRGFDPDLHVIFATYNVIGDDRDVFKLKPSAANPLFKTHWRRTVGDEGQMVKNPNARRSEAFAELSSDFKWLATGTPFETKIADLLGLFTAIRLKPHSKPNWFTSNIHNQLVHIDSTDPNDIVEPLQRVMIRRLRRDNPLPFPTVMTDKTLDPGRYDEYFIQHQRAKERSKYILTHISEFKGSNNQSDRLCALSVFGAIRQFHSAGSEGPNEKFGKMLNIWGDNDQGIRMDLLDNLQAKYDNGEAECHICHEVVSPHQVVDPVPLSDIECAAVANDPDQIEVTIGYISACGHIQCTGCVKRHGKTSKCKHCSFAAVPKAACIAGQPANKKERKMALSPKIIEATEEMITRFKGGKLKTLGFSQYVTATKLWAAHLREQLDLEGLYDVEVLLMNGEVPKAKRAELRERFKREENCVFMILTIDTGGAGLNLSSARDVHILEPQYNPAKSLQAMDRIRRPGQLGKMTIFLWYLEDSTDTRIRQRTQERLKLSSLLLGGSQRLKETEALTINEIKLIAGIK